MSAYVLPNEILYQIFGNLRGSDVLMCRQVCRRWEAVVDGLGEDFWKTMLAKEHISEVYEEAYKKAQLSWRELHTSLGLWGDVASARLEGLKVPENHVNNFQILPDGVLAVSCRPRRFLNKIRREEVSRCDTIVYYDPETLTELRRERFHFMFNRFEENEYFYVMKMDSERSIENYVCLILKSNKKRLNFGKFVHGMWIWVLHGDVVFLQCYQTDHFYRIKIVEQDNDYSLEGEDIPYPESYFRIIGIASVNNQQTNILASGTSTGKDQNARIYSLVGKEMTLLCYINTRDEKCHRTIKSHCFSLRCLPIFDLLTRFSFDYEPEHVLYHYAKTVMIHKLDAEAKSIDIYYVPEDNPYELNGKLNFHKAEPTRTIDLNTLFCDLEDKDLDQVDVVESVNGHIIVVSLHHTIFVIKLVHDENEIRIVDGDSDDYYQTVFSTQNKLIYTTYRKATRIQLTGN